MSGADASSSFNDLLRRLRRAAGLTGGNPSVCLEVGYASGKGRPTILLAHREAELFFDVQGHKCLRYRGIRDLELTLSLEIAALKASVMM
jgi:hypothetical protein